MVRILNFFCVALMGLSILALYHVSEKTRVAHMKLTQVTGDIAGERGAIGVLETEWQHVAASSSWRRRGWAWRTMPRCSCPPSTSCRAAVLMRR
jgi:hypothetical protein